MKSQNNPGTGIESIKQKYKPGTVNLLLPAFFEEQLDPFHKLQAMEVTADLSDNSGDVFKVGTKKEGKEWIDTFSPAKPLLMRMALAAGIQFNPNYTGVSNTGKNAYHGRAQGAIKLPDGTYKTHYDEKLINLDDEEDNFRLDFMDKSIEGVTGKAGTEAAKRFRGKWITVDAKYGKPGQTERAYTIDDCDRQKFIDRSVLANIVLLRKSAPQKALTGAILRVIRALTGLKGQYTTEELKKPFVLARVNFSPDFNDPEVKKLILAQGMASMTNIFGNSAPSIAAQPVFAETAPPTFDAANIEDDPFISETNKGVAPTPDNDDGPPPWEQGQFNDDREEPDEDEGDNGPNPNVCEGCGIAISDRVSGFSKKNHGRYLCMKCQKG